MKILHTAATYRKDCHGVSGLIRDLVDAVAAAGHEVNVMAPVEKGVPRENGVMRVKVDSKGGIDARTLTRLRRLKPDLIHIHDPMVLADPALTLAERLEIPVLFTLHSPRESDPPGSVDLEFQRASGEVAAAADMVVAPSAGARKWAATKTRHGGMMVIPTGVSEAFLEAGGDREAARTARGLDAHAFVVGLTGGDSIDAGLDEFLEALVGMMEESPSIHLLVTGTQRFRRRVARGIPKDLRERSVRSEKTGTVEALREWMDALDLLAAPSLNDPEGRNAQGAMARGVPALAPHSAPWARLLQEGSNGFLVLQNDVEGFRSGLQRARRMLRAAGCVIPRCARECVEPRTFERTVALYVHAYETLCGVREGATLPSLAPPPPRPIAGLGDVLRKSD